jgi:hypothetical protein
MTLRAKMRPQKERTGTFFGNPVPHNEIFTDELFQTETKHVISYAKKGIILLI